MAETLPPPPAVPPRALLGSRADLIRQAIEYYLDDLEDLAVGLEALRDPSDPVLDWDTVRADLMADVPDGG